jgi:hypothetical protein
MSFYLGIWHEPAPIGAAEAERRYDILCAGGALTPSPSLAVFRAELTSLSPAVIGITDLDPADAWRAALYDAGTGFDLQVVWRAAATAGPVVRATASRHGLLCYDPQAGAVHHPQWMLDARRTQLTTEDGSLYYDPDPATVHAVLDGLGPTCRYAIVSRQDLGADFYLQLGGHDGRWILEFRDGTADRHFRCVLPSPEAARDAFTGYALGTDAWQSRFTWTPLGLSA